MLTYILRKTIKANKQIHSCSFISLISILVLISLPLSLPLSFPRFLSPFLSSRFLLLSSTQPVYIATRHASRSIYPFYPPPTPQNMSAIDNGTRDWFSKKFGALETPVLSKLLTLQKLFQLTNEDIYIHWESFAVTQANSDVDLSTGNVDNFQHYLQNAITAQKRTPTLKKVRDLAAHKRKPMGEFSSSPGMIPATPHIKKRKPNMLSEPDSSPSKIDLASSPRKSAAAECNTIVETLNPHLEFASFAGSVLLTANFDAEKFKFRTMAMKLLESADVLDEQIDFFSLQILDLYKDKDISLSNPCMSSQFDILCCGRIVPDSPFYDAMRHHMLNDKSLFLETSRLGGIGQRIPLDLSNLPEYSLFAGQIVGMRGRNPTGRTFIVHEILDLPQLGTPVSSLQDIHEYQTSGASKIFVAAGPFTNQHTLNYTKLASLVDLLNNDVRPNVAILFGPFLDLANKAVEQGEFDFDGMPANQQPKTLDELFKFKVAPILKNINPSIQVILLPSLRDAMNKHASYPQSSFDRKKLGLPKNFKCFPNPCGFSVNEIMIGTSNNDIMKDLKDVYKAAPTQGKIDSNRFDRIAGHIFEQRRYYPYFPGSMKQSASKKEDLDSMMMLKDGVMAEEITETEILGSCLEIPYFGLSELGDSLPDILIIPSELKSFAKVTKGVVVINPGQFIRPNRDAAREEGNYTVLSIKPASVDEDDNVEKVPNAELYYHNAYKRCKVDIYRS